MCTLVHAHDKVHESLVSICIEAFLSTFFNIRRKLMSFNICKLTKHISLSGLCTESLSLPASYHNRSGTRATRAHTLMSKVLYDLYIR